MASALTSAKAIAVRAGLNAPFVTGDPAASIRRSKIACSVGRLYGRADARVRLSWRRRRRYFHRQRAEVDALAVGARTMRLTTRS
jgi:hypothetical protein